MSCSGGFALRAEVTLSANRPLSGFPSAEFWRFCCETWSRIFMSGVHLFEIRFSMCFFVFFTVSRSRIIISHVHLVEIRFSMCFIGVFAVGAEVALP